MSQVLLSESTFDRDCRAPELKGAPVGLDGIGREIRRCALRLGRVLAATWTLIEESASAKSIEDVAGIAAGLAVEQ
jgi:hypothetical protein